MKSLLGNCNHVGQTKGKAARLGSDTQYLQSNWNFTFPHITPQILEMLEDRHLLDPILFELEHIAHRYSSHKIPTFVPLKLKL